MEDPPASEIVVKLVEDGAQKTPHHAHEDKDKKVLDLPKSTVSVVVICAL